MEKPILRYIFSYLLTSFGVFKLIPLLHSEYRFIWPYSLSNFSFSLLCILAVAIIFRALFLIRYGNKETNGFPFSMLIIAPAITGVIAWGLGFTGAPNWLMYIIFGFGLLIGLVGFFFSFLFEIEEDDSHIRGRSFISFDEARDKAFSLMSEEDPGLFWGFLRLPSRVASSHFCVTGSTGSGKTISLRLLMQSVLPQIKEGSDTRALIYDAKQDMLSILRGICPEQKIVILNPFDERGAAWDMAADIDSPATAQQVAAILIPEEKKASQPFFADAARHLLTGVLISFIKNSPQKWDFRDLIFTMKNSERLQTVLRADESTKDLLEYFENKLTAQNIMSTVATKLQRYEFIAAAWSHATEKISLKDWVEGDYILLLGNDEATRTALDAINQVIFRRVSELILNQSESETRRTWVFLDEVREMGHLEGLSRLLTKGRSKGCSIVLGFQDIEGLRDVYGQKIAAEITGQCSNKAILRTNSPETARWASSLFGASEFIETNTSTSTSKGEWRGAKQTESNSTQSHVASREAVLPSEFMEIPPTTPENGLGGYYLTPSVGAYSTTINGEWITGDLIPTDSKTENLIRRSGDAQYLQPWNKDDLDRLSIDGLSIENKENSQEKELDQENRLGILEGVKRE